MEFNSNLIKFLGNVALTNISTTLPKYGIKDQYQKTIKPFCLALLSPRPPTASHSLPTGTHCYLLPYQRLVGPGWLGLAGLCFVFNIGVLVFSKCKIIKALITSTSINHHTF